MNQWIAFTLSNSVDVVPTVSTISHLERKGLAKKQKNLSTPARKTPNLKVYQTTPKAVYPFLIIKVLIKFMMENFLT